MNFNSESCLLLTERLARVGGWETNCSFRKFTCKNLDRCFQHSWKNCSKCLPFLKVSEGHLKKKLECWKVSPVWEYLPLPSTLARWSAYPLVVLFTTTPPHFWVWQKRASSASWWKQSFETLSKSADHSDDIMM